MYGCVGVVVVAVHAGERLAFVRSLVYLLLEGDIFIDTASRYLPYWLKGVSFYTIAQLDSKNRPCYCTIVIEYIDIQTNKLI